MIQKLTQSATLGMWKYLQIFYSSNPTSIIAKITKFCGAIPILWDPNKRLFYAVSENKVAYFQNYFIIILQTLYFGLHLFGRKLQNIDSSSTLLTIGESLLFMLFAVFFHVLATSYWYVFNPEEFCFTQNGILEAFNKLKGNNKY